MEELKECPFCGGSNVKQSKHSDMVICDDCLKLSNSWIPLEVWQSRPIVQCHDVTDLYEEM